MIPLYDLERLRRTPYVTYGLIALNMLVFIWELTHSTFGLDHVFTAYGAVPYNITHDVGSWWRIFASLFLHANWFHLASNMLALFIFADDVEDWLGSGLFLAFYVVCGIVATLAQILISPNSTAPVIGASGAIAGVLGAYWILFPEVRIRCIGLQCFYTRQLQDVAAIWILIFWMVIQMLSALLEIANPNSSDVAVFAHLGGFAVGWGLIRFYTDRFRPLTRPTWQSPFGGMGGNIRQFYEAARTASPSPSPMPKYRPVDNEDKGTSRSPNPPRFNWQSVDESATQEFEEMEEQLKDLRDKVIHLPKKREITKPVRLDVSGLGAKEQRLQALQFLSPLRGELIQLETKGNGYYKGTIVSLSEKQVMLRDDQGKSSWIPLQDILRVY